MSLRTISAVLCDGADCEKRVEGNGALKREVWRRAESAGWHHYHNSHFCPECWPRIARFLKTGRAEEEGTSNG